MTVQEIADQISNIRVKDRPILVGIEGFGGSGKTTIAKNLKDLLVDAYIVQTDSFTLKDKLGLVSPDMESYDLVRLERQVLAPLIQGKQATYEKFNWQTEKLDKTITIPKVKYIIVEGITAYFPTIASYYDIKIWVDTPIEIASIRGKQNDAGTESEKYWDLWSKNDVSYRDKYHPDKIADITISDS